MATLTTSRDPKHSDGGPVQQGLCGVDIFYGGCMIGRDLTSSGYLLDLTAPAADLRFAGVAMETVDNSGGSAGDKSIRFWNKGEFEFVIAATADQTYVGKPVYALTNHEVQLAPGQYATYVGVITKVMSTTKVRVRIDTDFPGPSSSIIPYGGTAPLRIVTGTAAFTTTGTTKAVPAGGLTVIAFGAVTPVIDAGAAAANGQLGFTEAAATGLPEVVADEVTVNRIAGTDSALDFNYLLIGY